MKNERSLLAFVDELVRGAGTLPSLSAPAFIMSDEIRLHHSTATLIPRQHVGAILDQFSGVSGVP